MFFTFRLFEPCTRAAFKVVHWSFRCLEDIADDKRENRLKESPLYKLVYKETLSTSLRGRIEFHFVVVVAEEAFASQVNSETPARRLENTPFHC